MFLKCEYFHVIVMEIFLQFSVFTSNGYFNSSCAFNRISWSIEINGFGEFWTSRADINQVL